MREPEWDGAEDICRLGHKAHAQVFTIRVRFFDPGARRGLCRAAKNSLATMQWGQDRRRRHARQGRAAREDEMTTISSAGTMSGAGTGFLDKERTIAAAGFNRWLVPPAALCIHLCIGMAYGFSVFWLPLSRAIGITAPKACPDMTLTQELFTTTCDWKVARLGWMFTLFFVVLVVAAAVWSGWL